jgi:hypothetical protein
MDLKMQAERQKSEDRAALLCHLKKLASGNSHDYLSGLVPWWLNDYPKGKISHG